MPRIMEALAMRTITIPERSAVSRARNSAFASTSRPLSASDTSSFLSLPIRIPLRAN